MIIRESEFGTFVTLDYDEEQSLANSVIQAIGTRWITGEFQALLERIYVTKSHYGGMITVEETDQLLGFFLGTELEPPILDQSSSSIWADLTNDHAKNAYEETKFLIRQAWREVWKVRWKELAAISDKYRTFPGDNEPHPVNEEMIVVATAMEEMFQEEVAKVVAEYQCSLTDAIKMVSDYMPRGDDVQDFL